MCVLKVSQVTFFWRRDPILPSEKHCSRVINETLGEIAGREKPWAQDGMAGRIPTRKEEESKELSGPSLVA